MASVYCNEIDTYAADWLGKLMAVGELPRGVIDRRSVADVHGSELAGYQQVHLFAGIGGWPLALRLAGWPDDLPVWTGSCPCQPFSAAGRQQGTADKRHLWPEMLRLVGERRPAIVFGEQVASRLGREWLAGVRADLEALGYAVGAADLCAAGLAAPHIRQRLFWVAKSKDAERRCSPAISEACNGGAVSQAGGRSPAGRLGDVFGAGLAGRPGERGDDGTQCPSAERAGGQPGGLAYPELWRLERQNLPVRQPRQGETEAEQRRLPPGNAWSDFILIPCRDGRLRRVSAEPGDGALADGIPRVLGPQLAGLDRVGIRAARSNRVGRLRGYGNAIVPPLAAVFVRAVMEALQD